MRGREGQGQYCQGQEEERQEGKGSIVRDRKGRGRKESGRNGRVSIARDGKSIARR